MADVRITIGLEGIQQVQQHLKSATAQTDTWSKSLASAGQKMTDIGKTLSLRLTAPITAMGGAILTAASDFQKSMNAVKAISGATGDAFESLVDQAKELGATTAFSASQAADGMKFLAQAGFNTSEILGAMPGLLDLAAAGQLELGRAADIASNIMTGFNINAGEAARVADVLAKAATSSNTNVEMLGEAMKFVAPVAAAAGASIEETSAAIGFLSDAGIQASMAGTSLRMTFSQLIQPSSDVRTTLDEMGISVFDLQGNLLPLPDIVDKFRAAGFDAADMMSFFGERAGPAMITLLERGGTELRAFTGELENSGGTAERVANTQMEGFRGSLVELKSALEGLAIAISDAGLLEFAENLADKLTGLVRWLTALPGPVKEMGIVFATVLGVTGPVLLAIGAFSKALSLLIAATGPVGLFILAATAAITAYRNWDKIVEIARMVYDGVKTWLVDRFIIVIDTLKNQVDRVTGFFKDMWMKVVGGSYVPDMIEGIGHEFGRLPGLMVQPSEHATKNVASSFQGMERTIAGSAGNVVGTLEGLSSVIASQTDLMVGTFDMFSSGTRLVMNNAADTLRGFKTGAINTTNDVSGAFSGLGSDLVTSGQSMMSTLENTGGAFNSFQSTASSALSSLGGSLSTIGNIFGSTLGGIPNVLNQISSGFGALNNLINLGGDIGSLFGLGGGSAGGAAGGIGGAAGGVGGLGGLIGGGGAAGGFGLVQGINSFGAGFGLPMTGLGSLPGILGSGGLGALFGGLTGGTNGAIGGGLGAAIGSFLFPGIGTLIGGGLGSLLGLFGPPPSDRLEGVNYSFSNGAATWGNLGPDKRSPENQALAQRLLNASKAVQGAINQAGLNSAAQNLLIEVGNDSGIAVAVDSHRARFDSLQAAWNGLEQIILGRVQNGDPTTLQGIADRFDISQFAMGTRGSIFTRPTLMMVGERGPERVDVNPMSNGSVSGGSMAVNFNGPLVLDDLSMSRFLRSMRRSMATQAIRHG